MEISFYHLQHQPLERALPALLEQWLAEGARVVVETASEERLDALDEALWTYNDASFLAHGRARDGDAELQPVYLTTDAANPNGAQLRVLIDGAEIPPDGSGCERAILLFDGNDADQLNAARRLWKRLKEQGATPAYWQQSAGGKWEKRA